MISLVIMIILAALFLAFSVFKHHYLINLAVIFLMLGIVLTYQATGYAGLLWVSIACLTLLGYEIIEITTN